MKFKPAFKLLLVSLIVLSMILTGCGKKTSEIGGGSPITYNGDDIYPVECADEISYWLPLSGPLSVHFESFEDTPLAKELKKQTGINVKYVHGTAGGDSDQIQLLMASNRLPDVVTYTWNKYPGGPQAAINEDIIYDLTDLIDKYAPNLKKVLSENKEYDRAIKTDEGSYYAFPFLLEEGLLQCVYGPIVRKDWLDKAGLSAPETMDDWENMLTVFKDKFGATKPYSGDMSALFMTFGAGFNTYYDPYNPFYVNDGKVVYGPYTEEFKNLLAKLHDWYEKGLIDSDFAAYDYNQTKPDFLNGKSGALTGYAGGTIGDFVSATTDDPDFDVAGVSYPAPAKGAVPEYTCLLSTVNMNCSVAISTNCKNPELAVRLLDYGFSEAGHNLFNFGIEGESYNWEDGYPKYTDLILNHPDGWSMSEAMAPYMNSYNNGIMVQDTRYIEQYYRTPQQKDAQKAWFNSNMKAHMLPEIYIDEKYSDKDADIMSNVKMYAEEMMAKFITGDLSLDKYDEYLAQLKTFGIEDAIKHRQEAYDKYLSR